MILFSGHRGKIRLCLWLECCLGGGRVRKHYGRVIGRWKNVGYHLEKYGSGTGVTFQGYTRFGIIVSGVDFQ